MPTPAILNELSFFKVGSKLLIRFTVNEPSWYRARVSVQVCASKSPVFDIWFKEASLALA